MEDAHRQLNALTSARTLVFETPPRSASSSAAAAQPPPVLRRPREPLPDEDEPEAKRPATEAAVVARSSIAQHGVQVAKWLQIVSTDGSADSQEEQLALFVALVAIYLHPTGAQAELSHDRLVYTLNWIQNNVTGFLTVGLRNFIKDVAAATDSRVPGYRAWFENIHYHVIGDWRRLRNLAGRMLLLPRVKRLLEGARWCFQNHHRNESAAAVASTEEVKQPTVAAETVPSPPSAALVEATAGPALSVQVEVAKNLRIVPTGNTTEERNEQLALFVAVTAVHLHPIRIEAGDDLPERAYAVAWEWLQEHGDLEPLRAFIERVAAATVMGRYYPVGYQDWFKNLYVHTIETLRTVIRNGTHERIQRRAKDMLGLALYNHRCLQSLRASEEAKQPTAVAAETVPSRPSAALVTATAGPTVSTSRATETEVKQETGWVQRRDRMVAIARLLDRPLFPYSVYDRPRFLWLLAVETCFQLQTEHRDMAQAISIAYLNLLVRGGWVPDGFMDFLHQVDDNDFDLQDVLRVRNAARELFHGFNAIRDEVTTMINQAIVLHETSTVLAQAPSAIATEAKQPSTVPATEEASQPTASTTVAATEAKQPVAAVLTRDECVRIGRHIPCPGEFNEDEEDLSIVTLLHLYWRIGKVWSVSVDDVDTTYRGIDIQLVGFRMDPPSQIKAFFVEVGAATPASRQWWYETGWWRKLQSIGNRHFGSRGAPWNQRVRQWLEQAKQQSDALQARTETVAVPPPSAGSAPIPSTGEAKQQAVLIRYESDPPELRRALAVARRLVWPPGTTTSLDQVLWYLAVCICARSHNLLEPLSDSLASFAQIDLLNEPRADTKRFLALLRPDWSESEWLYLRQRLRTCWREDQAHTAGWCREKALELVRIAESPVAPAEVKQAPTSREVLTMVPMESSDDDDDEESGPPTREETPAEAELRRKALAMARCLPRSAGVVDDVVWFAAARACIHQALHPTEDGVRFALDWLVGEQICLMADIDQVRRYWSDVLSIPLDQVATQVDEARNSYGTYYNEDHVHDNVWYGDQVRAKLRTATAAVDAQSTSSAPVAVPATETKTPAASQLEGPPTREEQTSSSSTETTTDDEAPTQNDVERALSMIRSMTQPANIRTREGVIWFMAIRACIHKAFHPSYSVDECARFALLWVTEYAYDPPRDFPAISCVWSSYYAIPTMAATMDHVRDKRREYAALYNNDPSHDHSWYLDHIKTKVQQAVLLFPPPGTASTTVTPLLPGVAQAAAKARSMTYRPNLARPTGKEDVQWFVVVGALMAYYRDPSRPRSMNGPVFDAEDELLNGLHRDTMQVMTQLLPVWSSSDCVRLRERVKEFRTSGRENNELYDEAFRGAYFIVQNLVS